MWIRIGIQIKQICGKLPYEEFSGVENTTKIAQKYKITMELLNLL